jgi:hypothetical protein
MGADVNAAGVASNMPNFVRQIQRTRMGREQLPAAQAQGDPQQFQALLNKTSPNGQEQNTAPAPGALQKERSQERGRQRDVGQRKAEGGPGQSSQVQGTKEKQTGRKIG